MMNPILDNLNFTKLDDRLYVRYISNGNGLYIICTNELYTWIEYNEDINEVPTYADQSVGIGQYTESSLSELINLLENNVK